MKSDAPKLKMCSGVKFNPEYHYLGTLCKRGHNWENTGKSPRWNSGHACLICAKLRSQRPDERQKRRDYQKEYRKKYPEKLKARKAKYYKDNIDQIRNSRAAYRERNADKIKAAKAEHYERNKEQIKKRVSEYNKNNPEIRRARARRWRKEDPSRYRKYWQKYHQKKRNWSEEIQIAKSLPKAQGQPLLDAIENIIELSVIQLDTFRVKRERKRGNETQRSSGADDQ